MFNLLQIFNNTSYDEIDEYTFSDIDEIDRLKQENNNLKLDNYRLKHENDQLKQENNNGKLENELDIEKLNNNYNQLKLDIEKLKLEESKYYKIKIQNLPIINIQDSITEETINFTTDTKELDLSNINILEDTINWKFLMKFYNLKTIILNYNFNINAIKHNEICLPCKILIIQYTPDFDNWTLESLENIIIFIIDNKINLTQIIIRDLSQHNKCNTRLRSYSKWKTKLDNMCRLNNKPIKLTIT